MKDNSSLLADRTLKGYGGIYNYFFEYINKDYSDINSKDIRRWMINLLDLGFKRSTIITKLAAIRSLFSYCVEEGLLTESPLDKIIYPKQNDYIPVHLNKEQLEELRQIVHSNLRDRALIETMYCTGVRISELLSIEKLDIDWDLKQIQIRKGKGNKERIVFFTDKCKVILNEYLCSRNDTYPILFLNNKGYPLSVRTLQRYFEDFSKELNIKITPHTTRHTLASHLIQKGMPIRHLQILLGHDKIDDTLKSLYPEVSALTIEFILNSYKEI